MKKLFCDACKKEVGHLIMFDFPGITLEDNSSFTYKTDAEICNNCYGKMRRSIDI